MSALANQLAEFGFTFEHLSRERPFANARRVSADDAEYAGDVFRREACAHACAADSGAR